MNLTGASSLGLIGTVLSMGILWINLGFQKRASLPSLARERRIPPVELFGKKFTAGTVFIILYLAVSAVVLLGPAFFSSFQLL